MCLKARIDERRVARQLLELGAPDRRGFGLLHEIDEAAAHAAERRDFIFPGPHRLRKALDLQPLRAAERRVWIRDAQADRAH